MSMMEICRQFKFEAAHRLPNVPRGHKCGRLHGHSYRVEIHFVGSVCEKLGWVCDFAKIDERWKTCHEKLDHVCLNEVSGLENPTSENLAKWIWEAMSGSIEPEAHSAIWLLKVVVSETSRSSVTYRGPAHDYGL